MIKVLITGVTGFVGTNLVKYLNSECLASVLELNARKPFPVKLPHVSAIIHLAGKAHDLKGTSGKDEYLDANFRKTKELFDLFIKSEIKDFIYFSSVKAAADSVIDVLLESTMPDPKTLYGYSKRLAEDYILKCELPNGKRVFIFRPCMIHGPGNKGNLNQLYKFVAKGIPYPLAAFDNKRSFFSIANLLFVVKSLLQDSRIAGGIYNLADDEPLSTNNVINIISQAIGQRPKLWRLNVRLIGLLARAGDHLKLPFNSDTVKKLTESYVVSNEKIKAALGVNELPTSSREGLRTTIESFQLR